MILEASYCVVGTNPRIFFLGGGLSKCLREKDSLSKRFDFLERNYLSFSRKIKIFISVPSLKIIMSKNSYACFWINTSIPPLYMKANVNTKIQYIKYPTYDQYHVNFFPRRKRAGRDAFGHFP